MFNEKALRKPEFDEPSSEWITLPDGQPWGFPKPFVTMEKRMEFTGGKAQARIVTDNPEYNALVREFENSDLIVDLATLAAYMLGKNYDLTDAHFNELLGSIPDVRPADHWTTALMGVIYGTRAPKPSSGGNA